MAKNTGRSNSQYGAWLKSSNNKSRLSPLKKCYAINNENSSKPLSSKEKSSSKSEEEKEEVNKAFAWCNPVHETRV